MTNDDHVVPFAQTRRRPDTSRLTAFAATAHRLQQERAAAAEALKRLLSETPRCQWPGLAARAELRTIGTVEQLGREVDARLDRDPLEAMAVAEVAVALAEALPEQSYPPVMLAQYRALAWKDRAQALCYLARYDESLESLDRAEAMLETFGALAHDQAVVRYVRATTLGEMNRFDESMEILDECRQVFLAHGDTRRVLFCGALTANLLHRIKRFEDARDVNSSLVALAQEIGDTDAEAHIHKNLGYACVELGAFNAAEVHVNRASELFTQLNQPLNAVRSDAVRGILFARRGEYRRAIWQIGRTRDKFLANGLIEEGGVVGLEMVDAYLSLGQPREAESLARTIVAEFSEASLNARAVAALGYLAEAITDRQASSATVSGVRDYIVSLRRDPEREFIACA